jgi:hypothetical protein
MHGEDNTDHDPSTVVEYGGGWMQSFSAKNSDRVGRHAHNFLWSGEFQDRNEVKDVGTN